MERVTLLPAEVESSFPGCPVPSHKPGFSRCTMTRLIPGMRRWQSGQRINTFRFCYPSKQQYWIITGNIPGLKIEWLSPYLNHCLKNPEMKSQHELLKNIQNDLRLNLSVYTYSKAEVKGSLKRVLKSVKSHRRTWGAQGYLQFIDEFFSRRNPY